MPRSNSILYTASWDGQPQGSYLTLPESKGVDRKLDAPVQLPMAYTADGSEVLVLLGRPTAALNAFGPLAWWPALGGKPRPALEQAGWSDWAPRGRFLAAVRVRGGERVLETVDADGRSVKTLFRTLGAISWVRISPDEKRIAFIHHPSRFDNAGEVRVVDVDGSGGRAVSPRYETCTGLAWNARTGDIWFTATADSVYSTSLWAARPGGTARRIYSFPDVLVLQDVSGLDSLLVGGSADMQLFVRKRDGKPVNLSWLGSTYVTDISHDRNSVLFIDGTAEEKTLGTWIRPLDGGEGGPCGRRGGGALLSGRPVDRDDHPGGKGNSSGRAGHARDGPIGAAHELDGAQFLPLVRRCRLDPLLPGGRRKDRHLADGNRWNGRNGGSLPAATGLPQTRRAPRFCASEARRTTFCSPLRFPSTGEAPLNTVRALTGGGKFIYARWNATGNEIYAVTNQGRVLRLDPATGAVLRDDPLPLDDAGPRPVRFWPRPSVTTGQAYSMRTGS